MNMRRILRIYFLCAIFTSVCPAELSIQHTSRRGHGDWSTDYRLTGVSQCRAILSRNKNPNDPIASVNIQNAYNDSEVPVAIAFFESPIGNGCQYNNISFLIFFYKPTQINPPKTSGNPVGQSFQLSKLPSSGEYVNYYMELWNYSKELPHMLELLQRIGGLQNPREGDVAYREEAGDWKLLNNVIDFQDALPDSKLANLYNYDAYSKGTVRPSGLQQSMFGQSVQSEDRAFGREQDVSIPYSDLGSTFHGLHRNPTSGSAKRRMDPRVMLRPAPIQIDTRRLGDEWNRQMQNRKIMIPDQADESSIPLRSMKALDIDSLDFSFSIPDHDVGRYRPIEPSMFSSRRRSKKPDADASSSEPPDLSPKFGDKARHGDSSDVSFGFNALQSRPAFAIFDTQDQIAPENLQSEDKIEDIRVPRLDSLPGLISRENAPKPFGLSRFERDTLIPNKAERQITRNPNQDYSSIWTIGKTLPLQQRDSVEYIPQDLEETRNQHQHQVTYQPMRESYTPILRDINGQSGEYTRSLLSGKSLSPIGLKQSNSAYISDNMGYTGADPQAQGKKVSKPPIQRPLEELHEDELEDEFRGAVPITNPKSRHWPQ